MEAQAAHTVACLWKATKPRWQMVWYAATRTGGKGAWWEGLAKACKSERQKGVWRWSSPLGQGSSNRWAFACVPRVEREDGHFQSFLY